MVLPPGLVASGVEGLEPGGALVEGELLGPEPSTPALSMLGSVDEPDGFDELGS